MNPMLWVSENTDSHVDYRSGDNKVSDGVGECERVHQSKLWQ